MKAEYINAKERDAYPKCLLLLIVSPKKHEFNIMYEKDIIIDMKYDIIDSLVNIVKEKIIVLAVNTIEKYNPNLFFKSISLK